MKWGQQESGRVRIGEFSFWRPERSSRPCFCMPVGPCAPINPARRTVREIHLGQVRPDALYALTVWVKNPAQVQGNDSVLVTVTDAQGEIETKWLHTADLDFYLTLQPRAAGRLTFHSPPPPAFTCRKLARRCMRFRKCAAAGASALQRSPARRDCRRAQRHLANRPILQSRPNHLRQRRREALRSLPGGRCLQGHAEGISVVQVHLSRRRSRGLPILS